MTIKFIVDNFLIFLFIIVLVLLEVFHFFYTSRVVKRYVSINENGDEIVLRKNRVIRNMFFIKGLVIALGVLLIFLVPLLRKLAGNQDKDLIILCVIFLVTFVYLVFDAVRKFVRERDVWIRKKEGLVFVDNTSFSKLPDIRVGSDKFVNRWGTALYDVVLTGNENARRRIVIGLNSKEAEECVERLHSFFVE